MKGRLLELLSLVFTCVVIKFGVHHQYFEFHYNQVFNNPLVFDILMRLLKQGHKNISSNLGFGSTHIVEP
jgi:hypothetical protein